MAKPKSLHALRDSELGRTLVDDLIPVADDLRQLYTEFGGRPYRVFLVWVRWSADEDGDGMVRGREALLEDGRRGVGNRRAAHDADLPAHAAAVGNEPWRARARAHPAAGRRRAGVGRPHGWQRDDAQPAHERAHAADRGTAAGVRAAAANGWSVADGGTADGWTAAHVPATDADAHSGHGHGPEWLRHGDLPAVRDYPSSAGGGWGWFPYAVHPPAGHRDRDGNRGWEIGRAHV